MACDMPECPMFEKLLDELGAFAVFDRYFDENNNIVDDAPQQLKDEVAMLREELGPIEDGVRI